MIPLGIMIVYFFLGCVMGELTVVVLTTPLLLPILTKPDFDPIWLGMMCVTASYS